MLSPMLIEMHAHTAEHSACSSIPAADLVRQVHAKGLQGIILTDHHYLWNPGELQHLRRFAGVPDHFLIMGGQEVTTPELGDVLVFGATASLERGTPLGLIGEKFPEAALVWAHPYRRSRQPDDVALAMLDAVEIFSSNHTVRENTRALRDWHRLRFTAIAGTDTHGSGYAGLYPTLFDHPVATVTELAGEIKAGRCRPFFKEIPRSGANSLVTELTIGAKGQDEARERIIIRTITNRHKWQAAERAYHITEALNRQGFQGGSYRVPQPIDEDHATMTLIEEGLRGKPLFDKLLKATRADRRDYLQLTARWLARLHNCRLHTTPVEEFLEREPVRLGKYAERFTEINHVHAARVKEILSVVQTEEFRLFAHKPRLLVQGHGDFHPKNVIIGQDRQDNRDTLFIAAIDFESSFCLPPAFDVGCFLAQFRNQFFNHGELLAELPEHLFLDAYGEEARELPADFPGQVELFRARTNMSIAAYLVKLGLGDSTDLWRVLLEAEQALSFR